MRKTLIAFGTLVACGGAQAAIDNYVAFLYGKNEVPVAADPDGFGLASVSINNKTNDVSWSILAQDILLPLSGAHIHEAAAGTNGPVRIDFSASFNGTVNSAFAPNITPDTAAGFYVNLHNSAHPGGAIRGQLQYVGTAAIPEPETYAMFAAGLGAISYLLRRRRKA